MPINPTAMFANYLAPPKSVADYDQQAQGLQQNALALSTARIQNQNALRDQQEAGDYRDAARNFGTDPTANYNALLQRGLPTQAAAYQKSALEGLKTQSDIGLNTAHAGNFSSETSKRDFETRVAKSDQAIKDIAAFKTPQEASASLDAHFQAGDIDPQKYQALKGQIPTDPAQFPQWQIGMLNGILSAKDKLYMDAENQRAANVQTGENARADAANKTHLQTAGIAASTSRANNRDNLTKDYTLAGMNPDGTEKTLPGGGVEPWIANAATRFNLTGDLPKNIGRGTQGATAMRQIQQEAARQASQSGMTPEQLAVQQVTGKKTLASFAPGGKDAAAVESANTALNHLETLKALADAQGNGNIRLFNQIANQIATQTGGAAPTNLQGAVTMVGPEISKAVIGANGGQGDREKVDAALAALVKGGPAQANGQIATMQDLFGGRLMEKKRSYERGSGLRDFDSAGFLSPAAQKVLAARTGGSAAPNDIHAQADAILRGNK